MENLTKKEREIIPQIVAKVVNLTSEQQSWILGWMNAKVDENESKLYEGKRRNKHNPE